MISPSGKKSREGKIVPPIFEDPSFMLELEVSLDFSCCICLHDMGVTLRCAGKGLAGGAKARAAVKVPCPTCGNMNKIVFAPDGTLHHVAPAEASLVPEPSLN
jgi:phage FluMu protein Com